MSNKKQIKIMEEDIINLLRRNPSPLTRKEIADRTGYTKSQVDVRVKKLCDRGVLQANGYRRTQFRPSETYTVVDRLKQASPDNFKNVEEVAEEVMTFGAGPAPAKEDAPEGQPAGGHGVGMPTHIFLKIFAKFACQVFPDCTMGVYMVGSALKTKNWRDVDVRMIMDDDDYRDSGLGHPHEMHTNPKWEALCAALSALGTKMTGLPIDFQIQQRSFANERFRGPRDALAYYATFTIEVGTTATPQGDNEDETQH